MPVSISDKGIVDSWHEPILLPPRTFGADLALPRDAATGDNVDFNIVTR